MSAAPLHPTDPEQAAALRQAIQAQLAWLVEEVVALRAWAERLPDWLLEGRPLETARTVKELYGLIAARDAHFCETVLRHLAAQQDFTFTEAAPELLLAAEPWNAYPFLHILERVRLARTHLLASLQALPPETWARGFSDAAGGRHNLYILAHALSRHDAEVLREVGYRLHESHLSERRASLPT